ncbi:MAG: hypothetical protein AAFN79_06235 [Pseudomonadota bacterium]
MKDQTTKGDILYIACLFGGPSSLLLLDIASGGVFADLLSPVLARQTVLETVPKLANDFDVIAAHHFSYAPDPYLYWYFAALAYATFAGCLGSVHSLTVARRPARAATVWRQMPDRWWKWLFFGVIVVGILLWPWVGPSMLATPDGADRALPPGPIHALLMSLILAMYAATVAAIPAFIRIVLARRADG